MKEIITRGCHNCGITFNVKPSCPNQRFCSRKCIIYEKKKLTDEQLATREKRNALMKLWRNIVDRCYNEKNISYKDYGARGISVSKEWLNFDVFKSDMWDGYIKGKVQIDRINNDLGYFHGNCRWVTPKENARNKRSNRIISVNGVSKPLCEWSEIFGISTRAILRRIRIGWTDELSVITPLQPRTKVGQENTNSKLTNDQVSEIRSSDLRPVELAKKYNVSLTHICLIIQYKARVAELKSAT